MKEIDRRSFLLGGALLASSAAAMGLAGCSAPAKDTTDSGKAADVALPMDLQITDFELSAVELEPITKFADEQTFDIVVVGAGCAGVPAVLTAIEEGATVACLQKQDSAVANGYGASAVNKEASTEAGLKRWMADWCAQNGFRVRRDLFQHHIDHSGETVSWIVKHINDAGLEGSTYKTSGTIAYEDGELASTFEVSTPGNQLVMETLAAVAEQKGARFFYSTPAVQLVQDEDGTVTGVIGKNSSGEYIKLTAEKGVILATGDYMNNDSLVNRYSRDVYKKYLNLQVDRTGDGHILGILAGSRIAPPCHAHQVHGLIPWFMQAPLIILNPEGKRFMNEDVHMTSWNTVASNYYKEGEEVVLYRFCDAEYEKKYAGFGAIPPKDIILDPSIDNKKPTSVYDFHLACHRADTLEELCEQVGLPYEDTKKSIDRYNELCVKGSDDDFGVEAKLMKPIETGPFYCMVDRLGLAAINGGFTVDENYQAIDAEGKPIPHLFGAGVCADNVCGGINWGMPGGFSNSHCFTAGRYTVVYALKGILEPSNPCKFEEVQDFFRDKDGLLQWENLEKARKAVEIW